MPLQTRLPLASLEAEPPAVVPEAVAAGESEAASSAAGKPCDQEAPLATAPVRDAEDAARLLPPTAEFGSSGLAEDRRQEAPVVDAAAGGDGGGYPPQGARSVPAPSSEPLASAEVPEVSLVDQLTEQKLRIQQADLECSEAIEHVKTVLETLAERQAELKSLSARTELLLEQHSYFSPKRVSAAGFAKVEVLGGASGASSPASASAIAAAELAVGRPVGMNNRAQDCFWIAAMQCLRHTPGFVGAFTGSFRQDKPSETLPEAVAELMHAMQQAEETGQLSKAALHNFRLQATRALPASDHGKHLVQVDPSQQRQQDTHEFLSQLLDALGSAELAGEDASPSSPRNQSPVDKETLQMLEKLEKDITESFKQQGQQSENRAGWQQLKLVVQNLLYEYSMVQWAVSATRMHSRTLSDLFEGQRLSLTKCSKCGRQAASGAEPFVVEEVVVNSSRFESGLLSQLGQFGTWIQGMQSQPTSVPLSDLLKEESLLEGYKCLNPRCAQVGCITRTTQFLRLPANLVLHINRAQKDGSRCDIGLEFESTLNLLKLGMVTHFGKPLDRNLSPCSTTYSLKGVVFHRGPSARSGHYFSYIRYNRCWARLDDDKVIVPANRAETTPWGLEASEGEGGAKAVMLFYQRDASRS